MEITVKCRVAELKKYTESFKSRIGRAKNQKVVEIFKKDQQNSKFFHWDIKGKSSEATCSNMIYTSEEGRWRVRIEGNSSSRWRLNNSTQNKYLHRMKNNNDDGNSQGYRRKLKGLKHMLCKREALVLFLALDGPLSTTRNNSQAELELTPQECQVTSHNQKSQTKTVKQSNMRTGYLKQ